MQKPLKILIIDNKRDADSVGSKNLVSWSLKMAPPGSEVWVRRAPDSDLPHAHLKFDAIILSGSATSCFEVSEHWVLPYDEFVNQHLKLGTPILGVCYGMQTLARCLYRKANQAFHFRKAPLAELGWQTLQKVDENELLEGLPSTFVTYESHYEELTEIPPNTKLFARSASCEIQGFQVLNQPVFGIQFHPEASVEEAEVSLAQKVKKGERSDWVLNPGKGSSLYDETVGKVIFGNFFRIAARNQ